MVIQKSRDLNISNALGQGYQSVYSELNNSLLVLDSQNVVVFRGPAPYDIGEILQYNLYDSTAAASGSTSATAATNVTTDVSPKPVILQIQDNGNDLEEGGDDFVDIDDMLLDELDLSGLVLYCDGCYDSHYGSYCNGRYNDQDGCCDGCCDCGYDSTTKARPPGGLKGQRAQEEEAEGY
ncbi:hypothetical protein V8E54_005010 [Elaphomyces granulatus]